MMNKIIEHHFLVVAVILFLVKPGFSQSVQSLYRDNSLTANLTIPFRVDSTDDEAIHLSSVSVVSASSTTTCKTQIDKFNGNNFFLKCTELENINLYVLLKKANGLVAVNYGPINLQPLGSGTTVVAPPQNNPADNIQLGKTTFENRCLNCHSPFEKPNRSVNQIRSSLTNISSMRSIQLTDTEITAISQYLNNL